MQMQINRACRAWDSVFLFWDILDDAYLLSTAMLTSVRDPDPHVFGPPWLWILPLSHKDVFFIFFYFSVTIHTFIQSFTHNIR
jgi:hypothetical protein